MNKHRVVNDYSPDFRLPGVYIVELDCGHRLVYYNTKDVKTSVDYSMGSLAKPNYVECVACADQYQRVKTVKAWPNSIDLLLACGHLNAGRPYVANIDPRTANVYKDTDVFCDICSIPGDLAFT